MQRRTVEVCGIGLAASITALTPFAFAETPKLNVKTAHGNQREEARKEQILRLAKQYDLKRYTLTRDILVEQGAMNHSSPVLTLNLRFLDNDDLALSAFVHEQGHWVLMERHRMDLPQMIDDLRREFPNLDFNPPDGDGAPRTSYAHIVVCMLEWQAMEDLVGPERARKVIDWKQGDHYKGIYRIDLNSRPRVEAIMRRYGVTW